MTKAQMAERIAELEKEVEALKAGASVETYIHYHYPQAQSPNPWWPNQSPLYVSSSPGVAGDSSGIQWQTYNQDGV